MQTAVSRPSLCALGSLFIRTQVCTSSGQTTASAVACDLLKCQVNIVGLCSRLCLGDEAGGWPPSVRSVWNSVRQSRLFLLSGSGHPNCGTVTKRTKQNGVCPAWWGKIFPQKNACVCVHYSVDCCCLPLSRHLLLCSRSPDCVSEIRLVHGCLRCVDSVGFGHFLANEASVFSTRSQSSHKPCQE